MTVWFKKKNTDEGKRLFSYWDGSKYRRVDPYVTWRLYCNHEGIDHESGELIDQGIEPFVTDFINALCEIFDVERWDDKTETGLTEQEIVGLTCELAEWFDSVKKNGDGGSISSQPTDSTPSDNQERQSQVTN